MTSSDHHDDRIEGSWFGFRDLWDTAPPVDNVDAADGVHALEIVETFIVVEAPPTMVDASQDGQS
jgi:hypothetical protein